MRSLAVLSMHTSPLAQPGTGDGGGMNVYVRELASALARAGVRCDVYTRAFGADLDPIVHVEPGLAVHHVPAGPLAPVPKEALHGLVPEFTDAVLQRMAAGHPADALHANYWLSGIAGHTIKHELDLPLVCTFHTLDRVKAEVDLADDGEHRSAEEARIIGCSDAVLASCDDEVAQLVRLYGADPSRVEIVAPGVDHAFFAPSPPSGAGAGRRGQRRQARRAAGLPEDGRMLLFVGRIQPLKGLEVAVRALAELRARCPDAFLVVVGGPSGPAGHAEVERMHGLVADLGLGDRVRWVPPQAHELLSTFYRAADVCVVPSRSESFGLVALEAAACGTPVVAAAVGGLTSLVEDGRTGFLMESRSPSEYAAALAEVLIDPVLAADLGRRAAVRAMGYTWTLAAERLCRLYADLTARQLVECR
ncbi:MAG TPA: glycosyltransferase [Acidimicrobiales bacterium]|nr:glycosyltransferase [Acidimicrobiales bacterium]